MTIDSGMTKYEVVQQVKTSALRTVYLCRDSRHTYSVIQIMDMQKMKALVEFVVTRLSSEQWPDFVEYFQQKGHFYLVFQYSTDTLLQQKMAEEAWSLTERLHLALKLLEKLSIYKIPAFFLEDALHLHHVTVSDSHEIGFIYELDKLKDYGLVQMPQVCIALYEWIKVILGSELKEKVYLPLNQFQKELKKGNFQSYLDVYLEYRKVSDDLLACIQGEEELQPHSILFVWWKAIKVFFSHTRYIWCCALCVTVVAVTWLLLFAWPVSSGDVRLWKKIGTVEVYERK